MSDKYFLDTNIFVYSFDKKEPEKQRRAKKIITDALDKNSGIISYQVVQEFINVAVSKFEKPLSISDIQIYLRNVLLPLCEVFPTMPFYEKSLTLHQETGFSFYDSLIITAAIESDCSFLYTEDLQHERAIRNVTILNPFVIQ